MEKTNEVKAIEKAINELTSSYDFLIRFDGGYSEELSWDVERAFLNALHIFKEANMSNYSFIKRLQEAADGYHQTEEYAAWGTGEIYDIIVELKKIYDEKKEFSEEEFSKIPECEVLHQASGYDEYGYYQAGFLYGTWSDLEDCELEHVHDIKTIKDYADRYGEEWVNNIIM